MKLFTIGFTQTTAEQFFEKLKGAGVRTVWDTRLRPDGQLSGFARRRDLMYLLSKLSNAGYDHVPDLAPTAEMLSAYQQKTASWEEYAMSYRSLLLGRDVTKNIELADDTCFLCSEHSPQRCHRRIAAELFQEKMTAERLQIIHL